MRLRVNGREVELRAPPMRRLLDALREDLGLTGTKEGCGEGECGACTVLVDGEPVNSCLVPLAQVKGCDVTTIEGLPEDHPLLDAFVSEGGAQCGICTPGFVIMASTLPASSDREALREGLAGNICRCTGYAAIYRSIEAAEKNTRKAGPNRARRGGSKPRSANSDGAGRRRA